MSETVAVAQTGLHIVVVSDVVCPWCFIGKRQLEQATQLWREANPASAAPNVQWYPFQLNPDMPGAGMLRSEYLSAKFGSANGGPGYQRVLAAANQVGLDLQLHKIQRQPNTLKPHALIEQGHALGLGAQVAEALFVAYFKDGIDLTDDGALTNLALTTGLPASRISAALSDPQALQRTADTDAGLRQQGVSGVPLFVIGRADGSHRRAVHGAQGADALFQAMQQCSSN